MYLRNMLCMEVTKWTIKECNYNKELSLNSNNQQVDIQLKKKFSNGLCLEKLINLQSISERMEI